jgi:hypothetical protein
MNMGRKFIMLVGISLGLFALALLLLMSNASSANLLNALLSMGYAVAGGLGLIAAALASDSTTSRTLDRSQRDRSDAQE